MKTELKITEDGSHTLFVPELDEHYHSTHGSVQESKHVFIQAGLSQFTEGEVSIFEVGLGTALNCILSYQYAQGNNLRLNYQGIEKYPIAQELSRQLNYTSFLDEHQQGVFEAIHTAPWNEKIEITNQLQLHKIDGDMLDFTSKDTFDLVYFDAFGPTKQAEMWALTIFEKMYALLRPNGILVTYSSKGDVKRALRAAGFTVKRIPGPPGKRQMIRAYKG